MPQGCYDRHRIQLGKCWLRAVGMSENLGGNDIRRFKEEGFYLDFITFCPKCVIVERSFDSIPAKIWGG